MTEEQIYIEYKDKVMGYLQNRLQGQGDVAEDLCADIFVKVYKNLPNYQQEKASLSTWIYHITQNTLYDYFRTNHSGNYCELDENMAVTEEDERICNEETLNQLADVLEGMDKRERDIILLHYYRGVPLTEIAEKMSISYSYVKILHNKALAYMKQHLKDYV